MRRRRGLSHVGTLAILVSILGCTTAATPSDNPESAPLKQVADVPLPGPAVRFDYQSLDASHGRLYIAHMNPDQLVVFDTKKREVGQTSMASLTFTVFGRFRSWAESMHRRPGSTESPLSIWKPSRPSQRLDRSNIRTASPTLPVRSESSYPTNTETRMR